MNEKELKKFLKALFKGGVTFSRNEDRGTTMKYFYTAERVLCLCKQAFTKLNDGRLWASISFRNPGMDVVFTANIYVTQKQYNSLFEQEGVVLDWIPNI